MLIAFESSTYMVFELSKFALIEGWALSTYLCTHDTTHRSPSAYAQALTLKQYILQTHIKNKYKNNLIL